MFRTPNSEAKTANLAWGNSPTSTQVNVSIVGEQGLEAYHQQAQSTINQLATQTSVLTTQQIMDLAEALTVFAVSGDQSAHNMLAATTVNINSASTTFQDIADLNGITVNGPKNSTANSYTTVTPLGTIHWGRNNPYCNTPVKGYEKSRISNVVTIKSIFERNGKSFI